MYVIAGVIAHIQLHPITGKNDMNNYVQTHPILLCFHNRSLPVWIVALFYRYTHTVGMNLDGFQHLTLIMSGVTIGNVADENTHSAEKQIGYQKNIYYQNYYSHGICKGCNHAESLGSLICGLKIHVHVCLHSQYKHVFDHGRVNTGLLTPA